MPEAEDAQIAYLTAIDLAFSPAAPYAAFLRADWERNAGNWRTKAYKTVFDRHQCWNRQDWLDKSPPASFWKTWCEVSSWAVPPQELVWVGGTYARSPSFFPAEQSQADWIFTHLRPLGIQPSAFMLKLRKGAEGCPPRPVEGIEGKGLGAKIACVGPVFPFILKPTDQEAMLSAYLWKHDLPSVWYGEGRQLQMRRDRYKHLTFCRKTRTYEEEFEDRRTRSLKDLLEVLHHRNRDLRHQPAYAKWASSERIREPFGDTDPFEQADVHLKKPMLALLGDRLSTAMRVHDAVVTKASGLKIESVLGTGLLYPRQPVYPASQTAVDILHRLACKVSQAQVAQLTGATGAATGATLVEATELAAQDDEATEFDSDDNL